MRNMKKKCLQFIGLMAFCVAGWAGDASAAFTKTISEWRQESVKLGDKTFTYGEKSGFTDEQLVEFKYFDNNPNGYNGDFATLKLINLDTLAKSSSYTLSYSVEIDNTMAPNTFFSTADLDVLHLHDESLATKKVESHPGGPAIMSILSAVNGVPDGPHPIVPGYTKIYVTDFLHIGVEGVVSDISNTFEQETVPEPSTWMMWSGLVGLGWLVRRKRQAVALAKLNNV